MEDAKNRNLTEKETEILLKDLYKKHSDWKGISSYTKVEIKQNKQGQKCYQVYTLSDASAPKSSGSGPKYDVIHPVTGLPCKSPSRGWAFTWETMQKNLEENLIYFYEDETKVPRYKRFLDTVTEEVQKSYIQDFTDGKKDLVSVMNDNTLFDNPKSVVIIKTLISLLKKDSIILDFFAGSGTTGQAVLDLNREDGGSRKFILCTNNEKEDGYIAETVTSKRLKRIMTGECYDGSNDFDWLKKNEPYGNNLEVIEIKEISPTVKTRGETPFDIIDENLYDISPFENKKDKIDWICTHFKNTMKDIESDKEYQKRWGE